MERLFGALQHNKASSSHQSNHAEPHVNATSHSSHATETSGPALKASPHTSGHAEAPRSGHAGSSSAGTVVPPPAPAAVPTTNPDEHATRRPPDPSTAKAVRLLWCDTGGIRRCRVVPGRRYASPGFTGVGITTACMAMPAFADSPAPGAGLSAVGEVLLAPLEATRVELPWCPGHQMVLTEFRRPGSDHPWECCPRSALRNTLKLLEDNFGLTLKVGFEIEFLLLERAPPGWEGPPGGLEGSGWRPVDNSVYCQSSALDRQAQVLDEVVEALGAMGVGVLQWHAESAPGQFELALQCAEAVAAADQLLLAKEALVGVAGRHGLAVSFLPKPFPGLAGSGCHAHISLWKDGRSCMAHHQPRQPAPQAGPGPGSGASFSSAADSLLAAAAGPAAPPPLPPSLNSSLASSFGSGRRCEPPLTSPASSSPSASSLPAEHTLPAGLGAASSPSPSPSNEMLSFLAGVLASLELLLPFTCPATNSYARLCPGAWAGSHAAWGYDNRETPLRVTAPGPGRLSEMHIELKTVDGAANPFIALAAVTVAGMLGIFAGLLPPEPCQVPPGELAPEAAARLGVQPLPGSLGEALARLQRAEAFKAALSEAMGAPLLQAYLAVRQAEAGHADSPADLLLRYS